MKSNASPTWKEAYDMLMTKVARFLTRGASSHPGDGLSMLDEAEERASLFRILFPFYGTEDTEEPQDMDEYAGTITYWKDGSFKTNPMDGNTDKNAFPSNFLFLQDENGQVIPKARLTAMRADIGNVFKQIIKLRPKMIEKTYSEVDPELKTLLYRLLHSRYPELTFCEKSWKARTVARDWYSNWYRKTYLGKQIKVEVEAERVAKREIADNEDFDMATSKKGENGPTTVRRDESPSTTITGVSPTNQSATIPTKRVRDSTRPEPRKKTKTNVSVADPLFDIYNLARTILIVVFFQCNYSKTLQQCHSDSEYRKHQHN